MSVMVDTLAVLIDTQALMLGLWVGAALLPVLVPSLFVLAGRPRTHRFAFVRSTAARLLGYPALLALLVLMPWAVFQQYFVPVLIATFPESQSVLSVPLAVAAWLWVNWLWALPPVWLAWLVLATRRFAKHWRSEMCGVAPFQRRFLEPTL